MARMLAPAIAVLAVLAGCGGGGDASSTSTTASTSSTSTTLAGASGTSGAQGPTEAVVNVAFQPPRGSNNNALGAKLLKANDVPNLISSFANAFQLSKPVQVVGVNGFGSGPFFTPRHDTIVFQYGFASLVFNTLHQLHPEWGGHRLGEGVGAVDSFILAHEFTHALISIDDLPVLGREEDAADDLATLILIKAPNGDQYVSDAAQFWGALSQRQRVPSVSDYADSHSLDLQRAFTMMCELAGSSQTNFQEVKALNVLPRSRLATCPAEYKQKVDSFEQVLQPHVQGGVNLGLQ